MLSRRDFVRLQHMRDACADLVEELAGHSLQDLREDKRLRKLVTYDLIAVGEAANAVSGEARSALPNVPWGQFVRTRNHFVHGYFRARPEEIWTTVSRDIPRVLAELEQALQQSQQDS